MNDGETNQLVHENDFAIHQKVNYKTRNNDEAHSQIAKYEGA